MTLARRLPGRLVADPRRVVARPFLPGDEARCRQIVTRLLALPETEVEQAVQATLADFGPRHRDLEGQLLRHAARVASLLPPGARLSDARRMLLGATFTQETAIEAAALFNPSIVPHPQGADRSGRPRVVVSFRATGEGHVSSLVFREATVSENGALDYRPRSRYARLPEQVTPRRLTFPSESDLSERVIFPIREDERNGIEDVRWVRFVEEDGSVTYYGTYTAYDGYHIRPRLLATDDFAHFRVIDLVGDAVRNKGLALFPRRVGGRYVMLGRQDNERNAIMVSEQLDRWARYEWLRGPRAARELVQIGNNGSPIETAEGWLVLTHGVGPMRRYTLGADLLDLDDPTRLIATLPGPLLAPDESERDGYVPNVVYSCGALRVGDLLVIPYAMSDVACGVATVRLDRLLAAMVAPAT